MENDYSQTIERIQLELTQNGRTDNVVDIQELIERFCGDIEVLCEITQIYPEEVHTSLSSLKKSTSQKDYTNVKAAAHGLKGMLANLAVQSGVQICREIEEAALHQRNLEIEDLFPKLEKVLHSTNFVLETIARLHNQKEIT